MILTLSEGESVHGLYLVLDLTASGSVEAIGERAPLPPPSVAADTIPTICYRSVSGFPASHSQRR